MALKTLDMRQQRVELPKRQKASVVSPVMAQLNVWTRHRGCSARRGHRQSLSRRETFELEDFGSSQARVHTKEKRKQQSAEHLVNHLNSDYRCPERSGKLSNRIGSNSTQVSHRPDMAPVPTNHSGKSHHSQNIH